MNVIELEQYLYDLNIKFPKVKFTDEMIKSYLSFVSGIMTDSDDIFIRAFPQMLVNKDQYMISDDGINIFLFTGKGYAISALLGDFFETKISSSIESKEIKWNRIVQREKHEWDSGYEKVIYYEVTGIMKGSFIFKAEDHEGAVDFFNQLYFRLTQKPFLFFNYPTRSSNTKMSF